VAVSAYILIQTDVGRATEVTHRLRQIPGFDEANDVTGPYDVIAKATAASVDHLGRLVIQELQAIDGVTRTVTCPIVNL